MGWTVGLLALFYLGPPAMVVLAVVLVYRWVLRARKARELEALLGGIGAPRGDPRD